MSDVPDMLRGCHLEMVCRARLGRGGYLHVDKVREFPRLTRNRGRSTRTEPVRVRWYVDGWPVADLHEAVIRLGEPAREPPPLPALRGRPTPAQGRLL